MHFAFARTLQVVVLAAFAATLPCAARVGATLLGAQTPPPPSAPVFDLPRIGGSDFLASSDLFPAHGLTFLIFWDSSCPRCVESLLQCEAFYEDQETDSIAVVGLHAGEGDPAEVEVLLASNGIFFPQLWDVGSETAQKYSIPPATFTAVLVDRAGRIVALREHSEGDVRGVLNSMLSDASTAQPESGDSTAVTEGPEDTPSYFGLVFHGDERIRFLSIDTRGQDPVGPYGETLEAGNTVLYRFDLEVSRRITRHLRIGALLRIGNEDEKILETGPEYLGSPWGSAFAEVSAGGLLFRGGYYEMFMTPLTMMRWDWDDNPRIGGSAGCGCGAAAGVLVVQSLEELAPELVFEGGTAIYRWAGLETRAFYAIPRRTNETSYSDYLYDGERARYALQTGGVEWLWRRADRRTGGFWKAGIRIAGTWEDERSVDFEELGYPEPEPFNSAAILTADWHVPVVRNLSFEGEWILWNEAEQNAEACCDTTFTQTGHGGVAGAVFDRPPGWKLRFDYIYLDPGFYSPFAALSYEPNREGVRVSGRIPVVANKLSASFFLKRLRETDAPYPGEKKERESVFGVSLDADLANGAGGSLGWLQDNAHREASIGPATEDTRSALVAQARYRFDKICALQLEYQRVKSFGETHGDEYESSADLYSAYLSARF